MRSATARLAVRFGGTAAFLLAIGVLGAAAPGHDDAKPPAEVRPLRTVRGPNPAGG